MNYFSRIFEWHNEKMIEQGEMRKWSRRGKKERGLNVLLTSNEAIKPTHLISAKCNCNSIKATHLTSHISQQWRNASILHPLELFFIYSLISSPNYIHLLPFHHFHRYEDILLCSPIRNPIQTQSKLSEIEIFTLIIIDGKSVSSRGSNRTIYRALPASTHTQTNEAVCVCVRLLLRSATNKIHNHNHSFHFVRTYRNSDDGTIIEN